MKLTFLTLALFITVCSIAQVTPEVDGDIYSLKFKNIEFQVDASLGAKVTALTLNGDDVIITNSNGGPYSYGSTLWPAPQSDWNWSPADYFPTIENGAYTAQVSETTMSFESVDEYDMIFTKAFSANEDDTSINISYTMTNTGNSSRTNALWELTRPPVNGITFWPTGPGGTWNTLASSVVEIGDYSWLNIGEESRRSLKFMADGSQGWYAHVTADRQLFIKTFDNVDEADFASGEGEIELWIADTYIELENLSAAKVMEPGESIVYEVSWFVREVPEEIPLEVGNTALLNLVNKTLGLDELVSAKQDADFACVAYPNPASTYLHFAWPNKHELGAMLNIYDAMGKLQYSSTIESNESVDIQQLNSGIYFYSVAIGSSINNGRFVKE